MIIISILLLFIAIISGIIIYQQNKENSPEIKLENLGYSKDEIELLKEKLTEAQVDGILNQDYNPNIISLIKDKNFKQEKLNQYLEAISLFQLNIEDIIFIVNSNNYQKEYAYDDYIVTVMKSDYYIANNLDRYITYHQKNKDIKKDELITRINSNLDIPFYTKSKDTDLSKGYLMIVNKYYKLDKNYVPDNLVSIASKYGRSGQQLEKKTYEQFIKMYNDALKAGMHLYIISPYRSYNRQNTLYQNYIARDGQKEADTYSARPGYSEHQTGLALDILSPSSNMDNFDQTKEYQWLLENAYKYGFILRYPKGKEYITGYMAEAWHYRYVGEKASEYIQKHQITYEEYYAYFVQ